MLEELGPPFSQIESGAVPWFVRTSKNQKKVLIE